MSVNETANNTFSGVIGGADVNQSNLALVTSGTAALILARANTYSGGTTISGGTLQVDDGGNSGTLGSGGISNNATLVFNRGDTGLIVSQAISGSGAVVQSAQAR